MDHAEVSYEDVKKGDYLLYQHPSTTEVFVMVCTHIHNNGKSLTKVDKTLRPPKIWLHRNRPTMKYKLWRLTEWWKQ